MLANPEININFSLIHKSYKPVRVLIYNRLNGYPGVIYDRTVLDFANEFEPSASTTHVSLGAFLGTGLISKKANSGVIASILIFWLLTSPAPHYLQRSHTPS